MFSRLFRRRAEERNVEEILAKFSKILRSDPAQNALHPDSVRELLEAGPAIDQLENATGHFGRELTNPIPVNGPIGQALYLSSLANGDGNFIFAHRLGSIGKIDAFETVTCDGGQWDILFFSLYHPRKSARTPEGYVFRKVGVPPLVTASTLFISDFPHTMRQAVSEWTRSMLGMPLVSRELRLAIEGNSFHRPAGHVAKLSALKFDGRTSEPADERVAALMEHCENQAKSMAAVLTSGIGCPRLEAVEIQLYCGATLAYAYEHYAREPDHRLMERFRNELAANSSKRSLPFGQALQLCQTRFAEYTSLYTAMFEAGTDDAHKRHWLVTVLMHLVERATGETAEGRMMLVYAHARVPAAIFDDAFKMVRSPLFR